MTTWLFLACATELLQVVDRQFLARHQHGGLVGDQHDRREIGGEIVERVLVERLIDGVGAAAEHERVAVGRRLGDARRAHHAASTADILDDHLLAQHLGEAPADDPAHDIGAATGRERHHHCQRPGGPALGGSRGVSAQAGGEQRI